MHSSGMRTARSPSMHCAGGGGGAKGVCSQGGCLLPGRVSAPEGGECLLLGGGLVMGGVCSQGGSGPGGVSAIPACTEADPPPVNRMTDRQV